jgi:hypothetical protein
MLMTVQMASQMLNKKNSVQATEQEEKCSGNAAVGK